MCIRDSVRDGQGLYTRWVPKHSFSAELGQMLGQDKKLSENRNSFNMLLNYLAEREGFEPPIRLPVCRISSAVHSTTRCGNASRNATRSSLATIDRPPSPIPRGGIIG